MNCYCHPDRQAIGTCVSCGKPICPECKVELADRFHCNKCADTMFASAASMSPAKQPSWFERHLNWTAVLSWIAAYLIVFVVVFIAATIMYASDPGVTEASVESMGYLVGFAATVAWLLPTNGWILGKKGQSRWHLLWLFIPFGIFVFLGLQKREWQTQPRVA